MSHLAMASQLPFHLKIRIRFRGGGQRTKKKHEPFVIAHLTRSDIKAYFAGTLILPVSTGDLPSPRSLTHTRLITLESSIISKLAASSVLVSIDILFFPFEFLFFFVCESFFFWVFGFFGIFFLVECKKKKKKKKTQKKKEDDF